jgi:alkylation response protein AidB-like acyl-CoA dehydrogenase
LARGGLARGWQPGFRLPGAVPAARVARRLRCARRWRARRAGDGGDAAHPRRLARAAGPARGGAARQLAACPFGAGADAFTLYGKEGAQPSALLVERDQPGLAVAGCGEDAELTLSDCRLAATARIGAAGAGLRLAALTRELFGASAAAAALGLAQLVLDHAVGRAADRARFGRRLVQYQEVQARLAEMATRIESARLTVYRAAWARDIDGSRMPRETSMARLAGLEAARATIEDAEMILAEEAGWLAAILGRWHAIAGDYDKQMEQLLLAGQTLTLLRPGIDGWHGRPRAVAKP